MNQYLDTLGLQPGVTEADIKKAYRRLAKLYHPDVNKDPDAQRRFVEITEAYNFLLEVGATPHEEQVNYAYNAHAREYAERRRQAREYARERQRQAAEEKWRTLSVLYKYSDYLVGIFLLTNLLFLVDYLLPTIPQEEKIVQLTRSYESANQYGQNLIDRHSVIHFEFHSILIDRKITDEWYEVDSLAQIYTTPLLGTVTRADIVLNSYALELHPVFSVYDFFFFLIPAIIILGVLYFRWPKTSDNKIGIIVILLMLFVIQMLVFFTGR
ncbi:J domain-containing protein [Catalinimonas niigatensis]|uniref:J domain-containing protein n=1 Tax=Catalinimonas niigatensis TaxID=1397264 RepID=UPI002665E3A1|nr:J domain-containing protein [Catalinimonas niigatensis]WPP53062.1 J domain-containing protein [Catalinimonas niigatensis]